MTRSTALGIGLLLLVGCHTLPEPAVAPERDRGLLDEIASREWSRDADRAFFEAALSHANPHVRASAVRALGRIQNPDWLADITRLCIGSEEKGVLREAVFALGQLHDVGALDALVSLKDHESDRLRTRVAEAIGKLKVPFEAPAEKARAVELLVGLLADPAPSVRGHACISLWRLEATSAIPELNKLLDDSQPGPVRWRACYALARLDDPRTLEPMRRMTRDPDPWVRTFAARGLRTPVDSSGHELLAWILADARSPWTARADALNSLAAMRAKGLGDSLSIRHCLAEQLRNEKHPLVLEAAIKALAEGGSELDAELLIGALEKPSLTVQCAALIALARVAGKGEIPRIAGHVTAPEPLLRAAVASALGHCGAEAIPTLKGLLDDDDSRVRIGVAQALTAIGNGESWGLLRQMSRDQDVAVRGTALLGFIGDKPEGWVETLRAIYADSSADSYWELRKEILMSLAKDAPQAARQLAERALKDPFVIVRREARRVLELEQTREVPRRRPPGRLLRREEIVDGGHPQLTLSTSRGEITLELYLDDAPVHVSNIIHLARNGFYDGLDFHRVVPSFVIQGGDPWTNGWGDAGYHLPDEINPHPYLRGTLGMPKAGKDTGGCQIFITHLPTPRLDGNYTVFGRVIAGMEVVDAIEVGDRILSVRVNEHRFRATDGADDR